MTATVTNIEDQRPHLVVTCNEGHTHVFPVSWMRAIIDRNEIVEPMPECVVMKIISEWYELLPQEKVTQ